MLIRRITVLARFSNEPIRSQEAHDARDEQRIGAEGLGELFYRYSGGSRGQRFEDAQVAPDFDHGELAALGVLFWCVEEQRLKGYGEGGKG
jgi:hypothetical protein